jgi:hypothetical protein
MTPRTIATVAAVTSLLAGAIGLVAPQALGSAFGLQVDETAAALIRLACAAYIGFAALAWLARDLTDPAAWRAVAGANAVSWALSSVVVATALVSGVGDARVWVMVAMQVAFALAWATVLLRAPLALGQAA